MLWTRTTQQFLLRGLRCPKSFALCGILVGSANLSPVWSQQEPPARGHLVLPPVRGVTAISTQISAEASYIASLGEAVESVGIGRRQAAMATEHELRNARQWVSTYFELRELNRALQLKQHPPYLDQEETRRQQSRRRVSDAPQVVLNGDLTSDLNWMLRELCGMSLAYRYLRGEKPPAAIDLSEKLSPDEIHHIRLTEGTRSNGQALSFRADDAQVLQSQWPRALRGSEFNSAREAFESARAQALDELRAGKLSESTEQRIMAAVDQLCDAFTRVYPPERRSESSSTFTLYAAGKRFLQSLAGEVYRAIDTDDPHMFDGSYRFQDGGLLELIQHMYRHGFEFAPPRQGDEAVYRKLFFDLRNLYMNFVPGGPADRAPGS